MSSQQPQKLVIICCHGIWLGGPTRGVDESEWLIASFQSGETSTFMAHIQAGLKLLADNEDTVLLFSGYSASGVPLSAVDLLTVHRGPTRSETQKSEAESYKELASANAYWGLIPPEKIESTESRMGTEERAVDSFCNLLFSITHFYSWTATWPKHVTVVSHEFKRRRFLELHARAIRWPAEKIAFLGIDPWYMTHGKDERLDRQRTKSVLDGEKKNGLDRWEADPMGVGEELRKHKEGKNPWKIPQGLFENDLPEGKTGVKVTKRGQLEILSDEKQPWKVQ